MREDIKPLSMTDAQWESVEKRLDKTEKEIEGRLADFSTKVDSMTRAMLDVRSALLGDLIGNQNGLISDHRKLKDDFAQFRADLIRWRSEAAEPAIKDLFKIKIQIATIVSIIMIVWTVAVKIFWK